MNRHLFAASCGKTIFKDSEFKTKPETKQRSSSDTVAETDEMPLTTALTDEGIQVVWIKLMAISVEHRVAQ